MKPVFQTKLVPPHGNCWAACVASLFELTLADVPDIEFESVNSSPNSEDCKRFWRIWRGWLRDRGYGMITVGKGEVNVLAGFLIETGPSPRGPWQHSVITEDGLLAHDPFPGGSGLAGPSESWDLIYPLDPTKFTYTP